MEAVGIGGSPVPELLLKRLKQVFTAATMYVIYGSSEAEPIAVRAFTEEKDPRCGYAVGAIHPWLEWKLANTQRLMNGEEAGELLVRGPHVVLPLGKEWFETGDIGYVKEGALFLTARKGNGTVIGGKQHYQVEHYLQHMEGIRKVAALAHENAFAIMFEGDRKVNEVHKALDEVMDSTYIKDIKKVDHLPVDRRHRSKIMYHQLKQ